MRHLCDKKKLGRKTAHRLAMIRNQVISLLTNKRLETTEVKAKATKRVAERVITIARRATDPTDHVARRAAYSILHDNAAVRTLFHEVGPKYKDRNGGYTRIYKLGFRAGDASPMALLSLID